MSAPPPLPIGSLADQLSVLQDRAYNFVRRYQGGLSDLEVCCRVSARAGYRFENDKAVNVPSNRAVDVWFRGFRDGQVALKRTTGLDESTWRRAVDSLEVAPWHPISKSPPAPASAFPEPLTYHPPFADRLSRGGELKELGDSLLANVWHESERHSGLKTIEGGAWYETAINVIARPTGSLGALSGVFRTAIGFNQLFTDHLNQVLAPQSLLAIALWGARVWRELPAQVMESPLEVGSHPVFLHPRALEKLIRRIGRQTFTWAGPQGTSIGAQIASEAFTLVDDPHMEGLTTSRGFDDTGRPTRRLSLVVKGKVADRFSRLDGGALFQSSAGNFWRRANGQKNPSGLLAPDFSSVYVGRGRATYRDLLHRFPRCVFVYDFEKVASTAPGSSAFEAVVGSSLLIQPGANSKVIRPGTVTLRGELFNGSTGTDGFLGSATLSRELDDTGTGILPYALGRLEVA
ncbi:MAG: metallopeptidase TldD-related protein [Myxococcota bacterium]|nr:metallopeptidase TldD-related protein [Myxococcota bacterium]